MKAWPIPPIKQAALYHSITQAALLLFSSEKKEHERTFEELDVLLIDLGVLGLDQRYGPEDVPLCTTERNVAVGQQPPPNKRQK
jgi:hypothetical protein